MIEIAIPERDSRGRKTKDLIFSILTDDDKKTLTQLHRELKKRYGFSVSFQSVIKAVNSLLEKGMISKDQKEYFLNND